MTPTERGDKVRQAIADKGEIVWRGINEGKNGASEMDGFDMYVEIDEYALYVIGLRIGRAAKRGEI
jgi:hypothetical protein